MIRVIAAILFSVVSGMASSESTFDEALGRHLRAIEERDLPAYLETIAQDNSLYMLFPDGQIATTYEAIRDITAEWFERVDWVIRLKEINRHVSANMGLALFDVDYRRSPTEAPIKFYLSLVFQQREGQWRLVHDQNTLVTANDQ